MVQKVFKTGNSLAVVIPSRVAKIMGIKAGDKVRLSSLSEKGKIILTFSGILQLPLTLGNTHGKI